MHTDMETHPWAPYMPDGSRLLIMGTFPPGRHRWSMDFYYPNPTNDFWRMCGLIFYGDAKALAAPEGGFDLDAIKRMLDDKHIALHDTCHCIRRLKGNASDKYLEVVEPTDLEALLQQMPLCRDVCTTGEKAAGVVAQITSAPIPKMGECVVCQSDNHVFEGLRIWRMPSTSRAYPLKLERKAEYYQKMFRTILSSSKD